uniref:Uncharacterized protein n=1 Tax=Rhizophora mucronata TaxID=61149 RepID=A0A2P2JAP7_RHIMU
MQFITEFKCYNFDSLFLVCSPLNTENYAFFVS